MRTLTSQGSRPRPTGGFELYTWLFMRVSGVFLLGLALGHLVIMHLINGVDTISFAFVRDRYATVFWRGYDLLMLWLALLHGLNGIRTMLGDYLPPGGWRRLALVGLSFIGLMFFLLGTWVIVSFQPSRFPHG
ncbi:MAG: succinate dehydrogenase [Elusimicrobia bacterium]|nr:succinate dehydrogenase [Elusimicrobiota bacterium]